MPKNVKESILNKLRLRGEFTVKEIQKEIPVSRQAIHKHIKELLKKGKITKIGSTRASKYISSNKTSGITQHISRTYQRAGLHEDKVLESVQLSLNLNKQLNSNAKEIFAYAFTEILNNAIEHSQSERILVEVDLLRYDITFNIRDYGIGIFTNIKNKYKLPSIESSMQELLKGKTTTAPEGHTGEGLFFTSKCGDKLEISSQHFTLAFDNKAGEIFTGTIRFSKGTKVTFTASRNTRKKLIDTFDIYAGKEFDYTFSKTSVKVNLYSQNSNLFVSRSIAKRILNRLDQFEEIIIDFSGIKMIGQGFADQIFRVFKNQHPNIKLKPENASEAILAMVSHVSTNTSG